MAELPEVEALEQRQLLQEDRTLAPGTTFVHPVATVIEPDRGLEGRSVGGEIVVTEEATVLPPRGVQDLGRLGEFREAPGYRSLVKVVDTRLNTFFAACPERSFLRRDDVFERSGPVWLVNQIVQRRRLPVRQVDFGRRRPLRGELLGVVDDRVAK